MIGYIVIPLVLLVIYLIYLLTNQRKKFKKILKGLGEGKKQVRIPHEYRREAIIISKKIEDTKEIIDGKIQENIDLKQELEHTYRTLVKKSTELEKTNKYLEKRVNDLSNINNISRTILSKTDIKKIIDILLDAYFVFTTTKKVSMHLWSDTTLKTVKVKGNMGTLRDISLDETDYKIHEKDNFKNLYQEIIKSFSIDVSEEIMVIELKVKEKELGVIYLVKDKTNEDETEKELILALGIQLSSAINNAIIYKDLLEKERISKELDVAFEIQKKLLPKEDDKTLYDLEISTYFDPAREIGGDYFDYRENNEDVSISIADVSGKGVPAAILMALTSSALKTLMKKEDEPAAILNNLNEIILKDISEEMFVTLFYSCYNPETHILRYSNAGHNPLLVYNAKSDLVEEHNVKGAAIGFIEGYTYQNGELLLEEEDIVIYYTDGVTEAANETLDLFGLDKLKEVLYENKDKSAIQIKFEILKALTEFKGEKEQVDDITLVVIKRDI